MRAMSIHRTFFSAVLLSCLFLFSALLPAQSPAKTGDSPRKEVKKDPSAAKKKGETKEQKKKLSKNNNGAKKAAHSPARPKKAQQAANACPFCRDCPYCKEKREAFAREKKEKAEKEARAREEAKRLALLPKTPIDKILVKGWEKQGLPIPEEAPDEVFLRRAILTVVG